MDNLHTTNIYYVLCCQSMEICYAEIVHDVIASFSVILFNFIDYWYNCS